MYTASVNANTSLQQRNETNVKKWNEIGAGYQRFKALQNTVEEKKKRKHTNNQR